MCQPPSTACNTISYSYKPTSKNPNYPFKGDAAVCKIILAHTPSQFLKSEEMPTEPCQATVSKTKIVGRLSKASDHPSLLLLIKRGVKINILCGLQKQSLKSTCSGWKNMVSKLKDKKKAWRQNENIPSYHSVSVSDGGCCYSNRTVIKASISSHSHTSTHSLSKHTHTHAEKRKYALFLPPTSSPSRGVCVWEGGVIKSFLITHLSHEKHSAYFVWALAVWLIQQSSHSNCSLYTKLPLLSVFFIYVFPHFIFLPRPFGPRQFSLFIWVYWCMLARFSSHGGKLLLGDSGFDSTHSVANDDRTIKVEGNVLFPAIYVTPHLSSIQASPLYQKELSNKSHLHVEFLWYGWDYPWTIFTVRYSPLIAEPVWQSRYVH